MNPPMRLMTEWGSFVSSFNQLTVSQLSMSFFFFDIPQHIYASMNREFPDLAFEIPSKVIPLKEYNTFIFGSDVEEVAELKLKLGRVGGHMNVL